MQKFLSACLVFVCGFAYALDRGEVMKEHAQRSIENALYGNSKLDARILNIEGMSSHRVRDLLNNLCSLPNSRYLEIGCWKGSTLISALYRNGGSLEGVVAIDNWSEWGSPRTEFFQNVESYLGNEPLKEFKIIETDCFTLDKAKVFDHPITVYFYDGNHDRLSQKRAFTYYHAVFDDVFIAVVDDWNCEEVRMGTRDAFEELGYQILFEQTFFTDSNGGDKISWWNGIYIGVLKK